MSFFLIITEHDVVSSQYAEPVNEYFPVIVGWNLSVTKSKSLLESNASFDHVTFVHVFVVTVWFVPFLFTLKLDDNSTALSAHSHALPASLYERVWPSVHVGKLVPDEVITASVVSTEVVLNDSSAIAM